MFPRALAGFARGLCSTAAGAGKQLPRRSAETAVKKTSKAAAIAVGIVGAAGAGFGYTLYGKWQPRRSGYKLLRHACLGSCGGLPTPLIVVSFFVMKALRVGGALWTTIRVVLWIVLCVPRSPDSPLVCLPACLDHGRRGSYMSLPLCAS